MNQDSISKWVEVTQLTMNAKSIISLGKTTSFWYLQAPRKLLDCLSYYKFAAKVIGKSKRVLDVGCGEGFGTFLLGKECGWARGIDCDSDAIAIAKRNFRESIVEFAQEDMLKTQSRETYDAIVIFSVIEHIPPDLMQAFWNALLLRLNPKGLLILGTPSANFLTSDAQPSQKPPVNMYTHDRLESEISKYFHYAFSFSVNDEIVHTGSPVLAAYWMIIGCKPRE
ncbi:MAG TPA: class I SAM-dependent methyltransferase [Chlamydiales bacterium]|nr:class I SAM-dependent methyltransferase [Chlamydiales bacterium]